MADHVDFDENSLSEFIDVLDKQTKLSHGHLSQHPKLSDFAYLHVFRSSIEGYYIQKFTSILMGLSLVATENCLIQFWVPIKIGDKCFLTTADQPFGLLKLHKELRQYRLHSMGYKFCVDDDCEENQLGVPGRVFRHLMPELSPDVSYHAAEEYPQLDFSLRSGVRELYVAPVIESSTRRCVGVVEFVCTGGTITDFIYEFRQGAEIENLKVFGLGCTEIPMTPGEIGAMDEIDKMMEAVGKTHRLPICQTWALCDHSCLAADDDLSSSCFNYLSPFDRQFWFDRDVRGFRWFCEKTHIRKGSAVVGRVFSCYKPCYCPDLAQFSISEYPLLHCARKHELNSCFAIYIRRDNNYILEFFLPTKNAGDHWSLMASALAKIEERLPKDYKVGIGEGTFVDFSVDAVMSNMVRVNSRDQPLMVEVIDLENKEGGAVSVSEGEGRGTTMEDQPLTVEVIDLQNESSGVLSLSKEESRGTTVEDQPLTVGVINLQNENSGVLSLSEGEGSGTTMENQPLMVGIDVIAIPSEEDQIATAVSVVTQLADKEGTAAAAATTEVEEQIREAIPFSKENLKKYIGIRIKRDDAAKIFGVSVPTFKRRCREYGIERWNSPNRINGKSSIDAANKTIDGNDQTNGGPCVEPPPVDIEEASTSIAMVKATYKSDTIKFRLSSSPGVAEVGREVIKRFNLKEGSFKIKYKDKYGDWILIVCDEDLQECINEYGSMGGGTPINMRIQLNTS